MQNGLVRVDGSALIQGNLSSSSQAGLMAPAGENGPLFLVFKTLMQSIVITQQKVMHWRLRICQTAYKGKAGLVQLGQPMMQAPHVLNVVKFSSFTESWL